MEDMLVACHRAEEPRREAPTFLGWSLSFLQRYDGAIAECSSAIEIDPEFGNPYNDIGVYHMEQGHYHDAIMWLILLWQHPPQAARFSCRQIRCRQSRLAVGNSRIIHVAFGSVEHAIGSGRPDGRGHAI